MKVDLNEKARKLLSTVRQYRVSNMCFTDEKIFSINSVLNNKNSRQLLQCRHQRSEKAPIVVPWALKHFEPHNWTFKQDWAPDREAKITVKLWQQQFVDVWSKDIWLSNSLDLNPIEFAIWSILANKPSRTSYNYLDSLKVVLVKS
uniref:Transposable element Tc1 transposase n=1 Tax=Heterorhabditis bacteriophora TaxID=37862 RepID=A0A1I7XIZ3_HETBA